MRTRTLALAALAATGLLLTTAGQAGAATTDALTVGSVGGANVNPSDVLTGAINSDFQFTTSAGTIDCTTGAFAATVTTNNPAGSTAVESITKLHADAPNCTSTIGGTLGVNSVELASPATGTVDSSTSTLRVTALDEQVDMSSFLGDVICDYGTTGSVTEVDGTLNNATNSITFTNQPVNLISGSGLCPGSGTFSGGVGPVLDTSQSNQATFVNP